MAPSQSEIARSLHFVSEMLEDRGEDVTSLRLDIAKIDPDDYSKAMDYTETLMLYTEDTIIMYALFDKVGKNLGTSGKKDKFMFSYSKDADVDWSLKILEGRVDFPGSKVLTIPGKKKNIILIVSDGSGTNNMNMLRLEVNSLDSKINRKYGGYMHLFHFKHTLYNPSRHVLTPPHMKLSKEEAKRVQDIYLIKNPRSQMPHILRDDRMARWLGLRHDDVVMITRTNPNSGTSIYYRLCI